MGSDETPRIKKLFLVNGLTAITFWVSGQGALAGPGIVLATILKFVFYVSTVLWLNTAFYLSKIAGGIETETYEFQREQIKLTLWIVAILILTELPLMISSL